MMPKILELTAAGYVIELDGEVDEDVGEVYPVVAAARWTVTADGKKSKINRK